jgi:heme exporter protein A
MNASLPGDGPPGDGHQGASPPVAPVAPARSSALPQGVTPRLFDGLTASGLAITRGGRRLFDGLSFDLAAGRLLLLLGPNGSGKSSLLRALLGLVPLAAGELGAGPSSGAIEPRELCRLALYQGHATAAKPEFTALENLGFAAALDESTCATAALVAALDRVGLARHRLIEMRRLSQGQKQRLQLARFALALHSSPRRLWLMDEPSAALDSQGAELLQALLAEHLDSGGAAIVATHLPVSVPGDRVRELRLPGVRAARIAEPA